MASPVQPLIDAFKGYTNGLLPMRVINYGQQIGGALEQGAGKLGQLMGLKSAPPPQDTSWHDQMVRQAINSHGARTEDQPVGKIHQARMQRSADASR